MDEILKQPLFAQSYFTRNTFTLTLTPKPTPSLIQFLYPDTPSLLSRLNERVVSFFYKPRYNWFQSRIFIEAFRVCLIPFRYCNKTHRGG